MRAGQYTDSSIGHWSDRPREDRDSNPLFTMRTWSALCMGTARNDSVRCAARMDCA